MGRHNLGCGQQEVLRIRDFIGPSSKGPDFEGDHICLAGLLWLLRWGGVGFSTLGVTSATSYCFTAVVGLFLIYLFGCGALYAFGNLVFVCCASSRGLLSVI